MSNRISTSTSTTSREPTAHNPAPSGRGAALALWQLNLMRVGYAVMGLGLAIFKWPTFLTHPVWSLAQGTKESILVAMSVFALLGLRYPAKLLPILLLEVGWKVLWLAAFALPAWRAGPIDPAMADQIAAIMVGVVVVAAIPWPYAVRTFVLARGEPWVTAKRSAPRS